MTKSRSNATAPNAKGTLVVGSGTDASTTLAVGTDNYVLTADSAEASGIKWAAASGGASFVGCSLINSTTQTITTGTWTALTWDTENFDTDAFHSTSTNTSRVTVPSGKAGKYLVLANAMWGSSTTGERELRLYKNGTAFRGFSTGAAFAYPTTFGSFIIDLVVSDYIEIFVKHGKGSNEIIYTSTPDAGFYVQYLGA